MLNLVGIYFWDVKHNKNTDKGDVMLIILLKSRFCGIVKHYCHYNFWNMSHSLLCFFKKLFPLLVLFKAMARIGANLCCLYDEPEEQRKFLLIITDAEWGVKLGKLEVFWSSFMSFISVPCLFWFLTLIGHVLSVVLCLPSSQISIQPVFRQQPEMKSILIPEMVKNRKITPDIILQYCRLDTYSLLDYIF